MSAFALSFSKPQRNGTGSIKINVEKNGRPFGQLWTFKAKDEIHPWHAKSLSGAYKNFYAEAGGLRGAKAFMEELANA